jgi:L-cysteine:1D-myo-inositol 2-amino-2-deoxy-alpha-D-glucopyranoside ligase
VISWPPPFLPSIPGEGVPLRLFDTSAGEVAPLGPADGAFTMYVCGITPYDATHLGHAATYVTFDLVQRVIRDNGHEVKYVQNVTDIDDPLFERADRDSIDFRELAERETDLFRDDMTALAVLPPDDYVGVEEAMPRIVAMTNDLVRSGHAYLLPVEGQDGADVYLDLARAREFGEISGWSARVSRRGTAASSGRAGRAGTSSARPSRSTTSGCPSTCPPVART